MTTQYFDLSLGDFSQNWTDINLITLDDNWTGVPSIMGYRGDGLTSSNDVDAQTVVANGTDTPVDVNANQTNPSTFTTGGVAEFHITNPTVALNGSGTADAPFIVIHLNSEGRENVQLSFNVRDLDGSADNSVQQIAVQYRIGETGAWTNLPAGYIADATTGPSVATLVTPVNVTLPDAANDQAQLQVRVITTNATGNDEWVGIDDISVTSEAASAGPTIDLSAYVRVGRYDLPEPVLTAAPPNNLLAQEVSGVTYNWDTDTLFVVGDGGRSVTEVSKTGALVSTMTLALGGSPQGTTFYDPEGITYIGGGQFVMTEERDRQVVLFTYAAGTTLERADTQTVKLGTFVDNIGLEGLSYDPLTGGFILVKEISPLGIFQTDIDFVAGTATNGSPLTVNSVDLFNPALANLLDFADVFALSNLSLLNGGSDFDNLLVLSQESGMIVNIDRSGNISSTLQIYPDVGNPLSLANQQHEGLTMDADGFLYVVSENGGGDINHPQLWVYAPSAGPNQAPSTVVIQNAIDAINENTGTPSRVKVADIAIVDDGLGPNSLSLSGADAASFEIDVFSLYLKAGTLLDFETKSSYSVTVNVNDATVGSSPDATANYILLVNDLDEGTPIAATVFISEVHSSGSGNSSYSADWFEVTNSGGTALDIDGWQMDDNSNGSGLVALRGVTSIAPGQSVIFIESDAAGANDATIIANFSTAWFGSATLPTGVIVGTYGGSGVGLSTGGDNVNLFNDLGERVTGVSFGAATSGITFDNFTGLGSDSLPLPTVSTLSVIGTHGAFRSADNAETGSPGTTGHVRITEVAPWSSGNSPVGEDWFEVTNFSAVTVDITNWRMDDSSQSFVASVALNGVTSLAPGESAIFIETSTPNVEIPLFLDTWFGGNAPTGLQIGSYSGSGVGLSTGNDQVNLYNGAGALQANVAFGASDSTPPLSTFDNSAGLNNTTISQLSAVGVNGAFVAAEDANEIGSPGRVEGSPYTLISEIQGAGYTSPLLGQAVTVEAIVVGDFQNGDADATRNLNGFYLQEEVYDHDGNAATSEGIFVFQGGFSQDVQVGDRVQVTGTVAEFNGLTQLSTITDITIVDAGAVADVQTLAVTVDLPAADVIQRPGTTANSTTSFYADLEAYEGMLVTFADTMTISEQFNLDQFVEVRLVAGANPVTYTQENQPDVNGSIANLQSIAGRTIVYDDGLNVSNTPIGDLDGFGPVYATANALRMGDTVDNLTGVLDFAFNQFRVRSVEDGTNVFTNANPRPAEPADVGGTIKVGSFNVLNYFTTLGTAITASGLEARGATNQTEFDRQTEKLVNVIATIDADVLGLIELENDFLTGSDGNAIEHLVGSLNAELGAGTYAWVNPGQQLVGTDAIAVGFIYKPSVVEVSFGTSVAILDDVLLASLGPDGQALLAQSTIQDVNGGHVFTGTGTSRAPLAVSFTEVATGGEFTAVVNHFKSKSPPGSTGADADQLDGQGAWQQQRELAAQALDLWVSTDPTGAGDPDVLLLGDFNAYYMEDVLDDILQPAGYTNLATSADYSYVFDGQRGSLDHILASASATAQVTGSTKWHINADEADALDYNLDFSRDPAIFDADVLARVSDHDPIIVGLDLTEEPPFTLQILHFYGETGTLAADTAPIMGAMIDKFDDEYANTLVLAEGDTWIPGPWLVGGADPSLNAIPGIGSTALGRPDIAILNAFGTDASALGNHEFDLGSPVVQGAIAPSGAWVGAQFPFVTANLNFAADSSLRGLADVSIGGNNAANQFAGKEASTIKGKLTPSTVVTVNGEKVGIIGVTTFELLAKTSPNGTVPKDDANPATTDLQEVAAIIQSEVTRLEGLGVNKIVLVDQLDTIERNLEIAPMLQGIDIMVAGGGHERLGDGNDVPAAFNGHDPVFVDNYPLVATAGDGQKTLIVTTDTEYTYLGRLVVEFDENGHLILNGDDVALTGEPDPTLVNGAYASDEATLQQVYNTSASADDIVAASTIGSKVKAIADAVVAVVEAKEGDVFGYTDVYLEGDRVFGRTQEVNLGDMTADSAIHAARQALGEGTPIVGIKNGGGIRAAIGNIDEDGDKVGKPITQLDNENALRFNNKLMVFDTDAEHLLNILKFGATLASLAAGPTAPQQGGYPQIGGVRFSFDPTQSGDARLRDVALIDDQGNLIMRVADDGVLLVPADTPITIVTSTFTAGNLAGIDALGGDNWPMKANGWNFRFLLNDGTLSAPVNEALKFNDVGVEPTNGIGEQQAFRDYVEAFFATPETAFDRADTPQALDERIQNQVNHLDANGNLADTVLNTPLVAVDDSYGLALGQTLHVDALGVLGNDIDNEGDALSAALQDGTLDGLLTLNPDGSFDFTAFSAGDASFTYAANDGFVDSNVATVTVTTTAGADTLDASTNTGTTLINISGGPGTSYMVGGPSGKQVLADGYENVLGGSGNDSIRGSNAGGILNGGAGNDQLFGGAEIDYLIGGAGNDRLTGGANDDYFIFRPGFGHDIVVDFNVNQDTLDLRGLGVDLNDLFANAPGAGNYIDGGANAVIHIGADDITLYNVTKAQLAAHQFDILV